MSYTYPLPTPPVVDTAPLTTAINAINAELDTISAAVEAIPEPLDLSGFALKSEVPSSVEQKAEITPIYDPLPAPSPTVTPAALTGATLVSGEVGSQLVNNGKVHQFSRTSTPPVLAWSGTLTISPVVGACKVRFGILTAIPGAIEVSINGGTALTAENPGWGWSWINLNENVYTDGNYTWFEVPIAQSGTPTTVRVQLPVGRGFLPCVYAPDAITSLTPTTPTGLKLKDPRTPFELIYRPSELATKAEIPPAPDLTPLTNRVVTLEGKTFARVVDTKWFDTAFATKYTRKVSRATVTSLSLEYKQADGTVRSFTLSDFATGFSHSGYWNGAGDPNGVTRFVSDTETVVVSWDGAGENLTLGAVAKTGGAALQIRKVKVNDSYMDWLAVYEPVATDLTPLTNRVVALESETHGLWLSKQAIIDWTGDEVETGRALANGDLTYLRTFTGTTPNSSADSSVFSIPGAKEIIWWHGQAKQSTGRRPAMQGIYSGVAAHGPMYWWNEIKTNNVVTAMELRQFNQTADTRYQNIPYTVVVEYVK